MHWGHIRDREGTFAVGGVEIAQQQAGGGWKLLGRTDGKGRWEIFKHQISGGGQIRISKTGYRTMFLSESEFQQLTQILLQATDEGTFAPDLQ